MVAFRKHIFAKTVFTRTAAGNKGFSVGELMVAMVIAGIAVSAMIKLFTSLSNSYTVQNVSADVQQSGRTGLDYMSEYIRLAGLDPWRTNDAGIKTATATSLHFTMDRCDVAIGSPSGVCGEPNGKIADKFEEVTFLYDSSAKVLKECLYGTIHTPQICNVLIENVEAFNFAYILNDGTTTSAPADPADVRSVLINMTIQEPAGRADPVSRDYSTRIRCRNIGIST